jgi:hypothetical protein
MSEPKDTRIFDETIPLSSDLILHVTITILDVLASGVQS